MEPKNMQSKKPMANDDPTSFFFPSYKEENDLFGNEGQLACDIYETNDSIIVKSTMAGVDPKNLDIAVSNDVLTVRGFREMEEEINETDFHSREIYWGAFSRSVVLPSAIDQQKVNATLKNGVLTIKLPKKYKTTSIRVRPLDT